MSKQRKSLKPYQLFLIGLVLLFPSIFHLLPSMYAGILIWFALLFWIVAIINAIRNRIKRGGNSEADKSPSSGNELKVYSATLAHLSATQAGVLAKEYSASEDDSDTVAIQMMAFCLMMLMRQFKAKSISPQVSKETVSEILVNIAKGLSDSRTQEQVVFESLNKQIGGLVTEYGTLPLSSDSGKQGGTLLWEYGKLLAKTVHKNPSSDVEVVLRGVSLCTNMNNAMQESTDSLIKSLK